MQAPPIERLKAQLAALLESRILTSLEPEKNVFNIDPAKVRPITRALREADHDSVKLLRTPVGREDFLWACMNFMEGLKHEVLVVGLGKRRGDDRGRPSHIEGFWLGHGDVTQVRYTAQGADHVRKQLGVERGEVIVVHNHPPDAQSFVVNMLLDCGPLPSPTDRVTASKSHVEAFVAQAGFFRFYLVEHDRLREFFMPTTKLALEALAAIFRAMR